MPDGDERMTNPPSAASGRSDESGPRARRIHLLECRSRLIALHVALVALVALAGCGGGTDPREKQAVTAAVRTFFSALADGDGRRACAELTASGQASLVASAGAGGVACPQAIAIASRRLPAAVRQGLRAIELRAVAISGTHASVRDDDITSARGDLRSVLRPGNITRLSRSEGSWKLTG